MDYLNCFYIFIKERKIIKIVKPPLTVTRLLSDTISVTFTSSGGGAYPKKTKF